MTMKNITYRYYKAWVAQDRERVRELLHADLEFTSQQDCFDSADSFLSACWRYSTGLTGVHFVKDVYQENRAFVILRWLIEDGSTFAGAEYLEATGDKIKKIMVINNDTRFEKVLR